MHNFFGNSTWNYDKTLGRLISHPTFADPYQMQVKHKHYAGDVGGWAIGGLEIHTKNRFCGIKITSRHCKMQRTKNLKFDSIM